MTRIIEEIVCKHIDKIMESCQHGKNKADDIPWELVELGSLISTEIKQHYNGNMPFPLSINLNLVKELKELYLKNEPVKRSNLIALKQVAKAFYDIGITKYESNCIDKLKPEYCELLAALMLYLQ